MTVAQQNRTHAAADAAASTLVDWLKSLATPLHAPLAGDNEALLSHPSEYGPLSDRIESFSRPLLAVAPWLSGRAVADLPGAARYASAARTTLVRGTDPAHPDYWGPMQDRYQPICEASAIAWSLHNARGALWEPLGDTERKAVAAWLGDVQGKEVSDSNWHLFPALTQAFLRREGYPGDEGEMAAHIERVFTGFYATRGWYRDGDEPAFDTYNGNQLHPYLLMLDELGAVSVQQSEGIRHRTATWCATLLPFFDEEGVPPFWGRSGLYRSNYLDGVAMAFRCGLPVEHPGDWRRAVAGTCSYFATQAITGTDGYLLSGYLGKKEDILDWYSCRASAYWLGRNCHFVQVPEASPFWIEPASTWVPGLVHLDPLPMALNRNPRHVVMWNLGITHHAYAASKYHNLVFSGRFGQAYDSGAAALRFRTAVGGWQTFHSWNPVRTESGSATVQGEADGRGIEIRFERLGSGANLIIIRNASSEAIEVRLGGFAVSGEVRETPQGLEGVEGASDLVPHDGFQRAAAGGNDGTHLWAPEFAYPVVTATLGGGATATAELNGTPGDWGRVLARYGGEG